MMFFVKVKKIKMAYLSYLFDIKLYLNNIFIVHARGFSCQIGLF